MRPVDKVGLTCTLIAFVFGLVWGWSLLSFL